MRIALHRRRHLAAAVAALFATGAASAQTTGCIATGPNTYNCNGFGTGGGLSTTNCVGMGGGMTTCNTTALPPAPAPRPNVAPSNPGLIAKVSGLMAAINESNVRKHVGQMLAAGDCMGASRYAYGKGRLELGAQIVQACQPYAAPPPRQAQVAPSAPDLTAMISRTADAMKALMPGDQYSTLERAEPIGNQLLLTARVKPSVTELPKNYAHDDVNAMCALPAFMSLMHYGASVRIVYVGAGGRDFGAAMVTRQICGF